MVRNIQRSIRKPKIVINSVLSLCLFSCLVALTEELDSVTSELHAVEVQLQELLERQQELIQKKNILTNRIKQSLEDCGAGESNECDSSPAAWNREGLPSFSLLVLFLLVSLNWSSLSVHGSLRSRGLTGETGHSLCGVGNL